MRPHLPPAVAAAIERCVRPSLVFDRALLAANMRRIADAAHTHGIHALFAAKSFAHPEVLALAGEILDGFDVASPGELAAVSHAKILSIADPTGAAIAGTRGDDRAGAAIASTLRGAAPTRATRTIIACETPEQAAAAPPHAEIAIRISASLLGRDPAIGAVLDGTGRRRSRFGVDEASQVAAIRDAALRIDVDARRIAGIHDAARGRPVGLHVHHGPVTATSAERFIATAHAALALAGFEPAFIDLGGAWHGIDDLPAAFAAIRAAIPASIELVIEPGRLYALGAGFACGRIHAARELGDRELRVVDLSRAAHLRWSQPELVGYPPHAGTGRGVLFAGPTCYEEDVLGEWTVDPSQFGIEQRIVLRDITGYAVGWNTGFGGIAPAEVVLV